VGQQDKQKEAIELVVVADDELIGYPLICIVR
jgi:hypothetical protein